jgi:polar amino acid transport system permease protein
MNYIPELAKGALTTIELTLSGILIGWTVGVCVCLLGRDRRPLLSRISVLYIEFFRGIPFLVLCMLVYYGLSFIGISLSPFIAGAFALALNTSPFCAEIIRGGLLAIPAGQIEAAQSLGFTKFQYMTRIILPEVFILVMPQLLGELTTILKNSSLVMVISVVELMFTANQIVATNNNPTTIYLMATVFYLMMTVSLSLLSKHIERRTTSLYH